MGIHRLPKFFSYKLQKSYPSEHCLPLSPEVSTPIGSSELVADSTKQIFAIPLIRLRFNAPRRYAVNYTNYTTTLAGLSHKNLQRIRGGGENSRHLLTVFYLIQHADRIGLTYDQKKTVSGPHILRASDRFAKQLGIIPGRSNEGGF